MIVLELASEYHIFSILEGGLAAAAVLISFGAVIGKHHVIKLELNYLKISFSYFQVEK